MARPRSFDAEIVLDKTMHVFWLKGYGATTMMDIQQATGLKPGSLYDSFGDKRALFLSVIEHYRATVLRKKLDALALPGPARHKLQTFFDDLVAFSLGEGRKLGCLMANSAVELAPHDADIKEQVQENLVEIADAFCEVITQGQKDGAFRSKDKPEDLARFLISSLQGVLVMAKSQTSEDTLRTTVRIALQSLD